MVRADLIVDYKYMVYYIVYRAMARWWLIQYLCCCQPHVLFQCVQGECSREIAASLNESQLSNENPISLNDTGYCFVIYGE